MTSVGRFQGVGGSRRAQPALEGRTHRPAVGARGAHCRTGAPPRAEQQQQRQATVQRRTEQATAAGQQPAGTVWQEDRRAEGPPWRDASPGSTARCHHRPLSRGLHRVRQIADRGDDDGSRRAAGIRSARATTVDCDRTPCVWLPVRRLRHADSGGIPRRGDRAGAIRRTHQRVRTVSAALPVAT